MEGVGVDLVLERMDQKGEGEDLDRTQGKALLSYMVHHEVVGVEEGLALLSGIVENEAGVVGCIDLVVDVRYQRDHPEVGTSS